jgi:peptide methionine sulfoxide reductase MsrA
VGTQYRSAIFYQTPEQARIAQEVIEELEAAKIWDAPIVTEVTPFKAFYPAEDDHQEYFRHKPDQPYCRVVIEARGEHIPTTSVVGYSPYKNHSKRHFHTACMGLIKRPNSQ